MEKETQEIFSLLESLSPEQKAELALMLNGQAKAAEPVRLCEYLEKFWDHQNSRYIIEEKAYGRDISIRHCEENARLARRYWLPYFGPDFLVQELSKNRLEEFLMDLRLNKKLAGATVNHVLSAASPAFRYLKKKGLIFFNPLEKAERFDARPRLRGIPTEEEIRRLLEVRWFNRAAFLAFKLSAFFGLRAGEISALRTMDLDFENGKILVRHSWNISDGLKPTKNREERDIPCEKEVLLELLSYAVKNPLFSQKSFVLWSHRNNTIPYAPICFKNNFYSALKKIGIGTAERCERNIVFHSLRHFCATALSSHANMHTVQQILGHKSPLLTEHYSAHSSEEKFMAQKTALQKCREQITKKA